MVISMIAAMTRDRVIGINNSLPWKLPADMQWFRQQTMGKPIIMGRKTFESFGAKPLPGRKNIIITRDQNYKVEGCDVVHSIDEALTLANSAEEVMVIGGAELYRQVLSDTDTIYLTRIHEAFEGDTRFPEIHNTEWHQVERIDHEADEKNSHDYSFIRLDRVHAG